MKIRNIISAVAAAAVATTALAVAASAETASITFQSSSYIYRNTLNQPSVLYWDNDLGEPADYEGASFTDATINGNGTYTVSLSGIEDGGWNMLKVETDIDTDANPNVVMTVKSVELNGTAVDFDAEAAAMNITALASDEYSASEFSVANAARVQLINVYDNLAAIPNDTYTDVKVTFEITGFDEAAAPAENETATDTAAPAGDKGSPDTGVEGIAVVAGAAIAAGGVLMLSKKRK